METARKKRRYRKVLVRVRFPDGTMVQATFGVQASAWSEAGPPPAHDGPRRPLLLHAMRVRPGAGPRDRC